MRRVIAFHGSPGHPDDFLPLKNLLHQYPWITPIPGKLKELKIYQGYPSVLFADSSDIIMGYSFGCHYAIKHFLEEKGDKLVLLSPYLLFDPPKANKVKMFFLNSVLFKWVLGLILPKMLPGFIKTSCLPQEVPNGYSDYVLKILGQPVTIQYSLVEKMLFDRNIKKLLRLLREHQNRVFVIYGKEDQTSTFETFIKPILDQLPESHQLALENAGHCIQWTHPIEISQFLNKQVFND